MFRVTNFRCLKNPPLNDDGTVNFGEEFLRKIGESYCSGQLETELAALAFWVKFTLRSNISRRKFRHLAEFLDRLNEVAFNGIHDNMDLAESMF